LTFDPRRERDTYNKVRKELLKIEWVTSTLQPMYDMPLAYDHSITKRTIEKVSTLKSFLKSFLELMKDETTLNALHGMINQCMKDKEALSAQRAVNQVQHKKMMNREFRLNAKVGDYDMDNIILDLRYDVNVIPK